MIRRALVLLISVAALTLVLASGCCPGEESRGGPTSCQVGQILR